MVSLQICESDSLNGAVSSLALNSLFGSLLSSLLTEEQYYTYLDQGPNEWKEFYYFEPFNLLWPTTTQCIALIVVQWIFPFLFYLVIAQWLISSVVLAINGCFQEKATIDSCGVKTPIEVMYVFMWSHEMWDACLLNISIVRKKDLFFKTFLLICTRSTSNLAFTQQVVSLASLALGFEVWLTDAKYTFPADFDAQITKVFFFCFNFSSDITPEIFDWIMVEQNRVLMNSVFMGNFFINFSHHNTLLNSSRHTKPSTTHPSKCHVSSITLSLQEN